MLIKCFTYLGIIEKNNSQLTPLHACVGATFKK
ncbi:hypothetical protein DSUL_100067 [Desulfovibrionales bacterium]